MNRSVKKALKPLKNFSKAFLVDTQKKQVEIKKIKIILNMINMTCLRRYL